MKSKFIAIILISILAFTSCNNPLNKKFKPNTFIQDMEEIEKARKINKDETKMIRGYIMLAAFGGKNLDEMTYSQILEEAYKVKDRLNTDN